MLNLFGDDVPIPRKIQQLVEEVLNEIKEARDSDMVLYTEVWKRQGFKFEETFLKTAYNPETIGRHRRFLQSRGQYPSTRKTERQQTREKYHNFYKS